MAGHFLASLIDILAIWVLFDRFQVVKGWTLYEVGLIYGIIQIGFALAECFARGFDTFAHLIKQGEFDRILLRPRSTLFQIATREVQIFRLGRLLQGLIVLLISIAKLGYSLFSLHAFIVLFSIAGTMATFYGLFIIQATITFWTTETLEMMNITTFGGVFAGQFPMSFYPRPFRLIFTLIIPLACVAYYPIATLLQHESIPLWLAFIAPLAGFAFLFVACNFWHFGVRHYRSTGS